MRILFGYNQWDGVPFYWNLLNAVNPHGMIVGFSGAGKTYNITKIVEQAAKFEQIERIYVFDVHGDIGDELGEDTCSTIKYSESSNNGINPLSISSNKDFGGPRKKIRNFINLLNSASASSIGSRQEAALGRVMEQLYLSKGIHPKKPETWDREPPSLENLQVFLLKYSEALMTGSTFVVTKSLSKVNSKLKRLRDEFRFSNDAEHSVAEIKNLKQNAIEAYTDFIINLQSGEEMDNLLKFDSSQIMKSLYDRISALESTGIFKEGGDHFDDKKKVFRFDLRTLSNEEQSLFISTMSEKIYTNIIERGLSNHPREIIIVDEAQKYIKDDPDHILNQVITGARKFGLGLWMASQSIHHFSEDLLMNTGMKLVLGVDDVFKKRVASKTGIEEKSLAFIRPKISALTNVRSQSTDDHFGWTQIVFNEKNVKRR